MRVALSLLSLAAWLWLVPCAATAADNPASRTDTSDPLTPLPAALQSVLRDYFAVQQALAADSTTGVAKRAEAIAATAAGDQEGIFPADFAAQAKALAAAGDLKAARTAFKPVSKTLIAVMASGKYPRTYAVAEVFCPMVRAGWLQADGKTVANPYHGSEMLTCGGVMRTF